MDGQIDVFDVSICEVIKSHFYHPRFYLYHRQKTLVSICFATIRKQADGLFFCHMQKNKPEQSELCSGMERTTGIEPATPAWEAEVLPLNYIRR
jgi:hypothetical protein